MRLRVRGKEYYYWKRDVLKTSKVCAQCSSTEKLEADHIKSWITHPELRFDRNNGQALCRDCHKKKTKLDQDLARQLKSKQ